MDASDGLIFYFRALFKKVGLPWDLDNEVEVRGIVKDIIAEAVEQASRGWRDDR